MPNTRRDMCEKAVKLQRRLIISECTTLYELLVALDSKPSWDVRVLENQGVPSLIDIHDLLRRQCEETLSNLGVKLS